MAELRLEDVHVSYGPSPALVETDSSTQPSKPAYQPHPDNERPQHQPSGPDEGKTDR